MNLCQINPISRYTTFESLKHPFVTRDIKDKIPLTHLQKYEKKKKISNFKNVRLKIYKMLLILCTLQAIAINKFKNTQLARNKYKRKKTVKMISSTAHIHNKKSNFPIKLSSGKLLNNHISIINHNNSNSNLLSRKNTEASESDRFLNIKFKPFSNNKMLPILNHKKEGINTKLIDTKEEKFSTTQLKFLPSFNTKIPNINDKKKKEFTGNEIKKSKSNLLISKKLIG